MAEATTQLAVPQLDMLGSRPTEAQQALLKRMRQCFAQAEEFEAAMRREMVDDQRFRAGEQWSPREETARRAAGRPCLTVNTLPQYERQITNELRLNMPSITVLPVGSGADVQTAKTLKGIVRHIEQASHADQVRHRAFESAVRIGMGYYRLVLEYDDWMSFTQEPRLAGFRNPFRVYLDCGAQDPTGRDAEWAFVFEQCEKTLFQDEYNVTERELQSWSSLSSTGDTWIGRDQIRIAEYFWRDKHRVTLAEFQDGQTGLLEPLLLQPLEQLPNPAQVQKFVGDVLLTPRPRTAPLLPWMQAMVATAPNWLDGLPPDWVQMYAGWLAQVIGSVARVRPTVYEMVRWIKTNGYMILEESIWPGKSIPIIRVVGEELDLNNQLTRSGIVRYAKDPMRMENYWLPLALDTPVPTPQGWKAMGEIATGDTVFDEQGMPCEVLGRSPIHLDHDCYRVTFDDGSSIVADAEHQWTVEERGKRIPEGFAYTMRTVSTSALVPGNHSIISTLPLDLPKQELPLDPYVLGVWLGDGTAHCPEINVGTQDVESLRDILEGCGVSLGPTRRDNVGTWRITLLGTRPVFKRLGLLNNKHIPPVYLRASYGQRLALLQGLMDTDGTMSKTGQGDFTTSSDVLRDGMAELLRTLGLKARWYGRTRRPQVFPNGKIYQAQPLYQFAFSLADSTPVFRLPRKLARQRRTRPFHPRRTQRYRIIAVDAVPSVPVRCIAVASASHLFLAGQAMVPTHNTMQAEHIALSPVPPWLVQEGQIEGYEDMWARANRVPYPYLLYKGQNLHGQPAPPPTRNSFEPPIQAITVAQQTTQLYSQHAMGIHLTNIGAPNQKERSGKAIDARDRQADTGSYHYVDNLGQAMQYEGEQLVDILPKVLTPGKIQRILGDDGSPQMVALFNSQAGQMAPTLMQGLAGVFDIGTGTYDVQVEVGPSYATKRQEASQNMRDVYQAAPQAMQQVLWKFIAMQDWEGADELAELIKKLPGQILEEPAGTNKDQQLAQLQQQIPQLMQQLQALDAFGKQAQGEIARLNEENKTLQAGHDLKLHELNVKADDTRIQAWAEIQKAAIERDKLSLEQQKERHAVVGHVATVRQELQAMQAMLDKLDADEAAQSAPSESTSEAEGAEGAGG